MSLQVIFEEDYILMLGNSTHSLLYAKKLRQQTNAYTPLHEIHVRVYTCEMKLRDVAVTGITGV